MFGLSICFQLINTKISTAETLPRSDPSNKNSFQTKPVNSTHTEKATDQTLLNPNNMLSIFYIDAVNWLLISEFAEETPGIMDKLKSFVCEPSHVTKMIKTLNNTASNARVYSLDLVHVHSAYFTNRISQISSQQDPESYFAQWKRLSDKNLEYMEEFYYQFNFNFFTDFGLIYGHSWYYIYRLFYEKIGIFWKYDVPENYPSIQDEKSHLF